MLWCVDRAAALNCNGYGFESWLADYLDKGSVYWRGASIRLYKVVYTGGTYFLVLFCLLSQAAILDV